MTHRHTLHKRAYLAGLLLVLLVLYSAPVAAETIAIAIYDTDSLENTAPLLLLFEEGVMDDLFFSGHIVFDLDLDEADGADDAYRTARAIVEARLGGAAYVVLYGVSFRTVQGRGLLPEISTVTVYDVEGGDGIEAGVVSAGDLPRYDQLSPADISLALGSASVQATLDGILEVEATW